MSKDIEQVVATIPDWLFDRIAQWSEMNAAGMRSVVDQMKSSMGNAAWTQQEPSEEMITELRIASAIMRYKIAQDKARTRRDEMNDMIEQEVERLRSL